MSISGDELEQVIAGINSSWLDRAKEEKAELAIKCWRLDGFINSITFDKLESLDQKDLLVQRNYMEAYLEALDRRIQRQVA